VRADRKARREDGQNRKEPKRAPTLAELHNRLMRLARAALDRASSDLKEGRDASRAAITAGIATQRALEVHRAIDLGGLPAKLPTDELGAREVAVLALWRQARSGNPGAMRKLTEALGLADIIKGARLELAFADPPAPPPAAPSSPPGQ
jgi:hypothetical protein